MFPRIMRLRCHVLLFVLLLKIIFLVWYFSGKKQSQKSLLIRLGDGSDPSVLPGILHLADDPALDVFKWYGADACVKEGSDPSLSTSGHCSCLPGWGGKRCGLPQSLLGVRWMTEPVLVAGLQVRKRPRRILLVVSDFLQDFRLLELNFRTLADLVDVFIVGEVESRYTRRNESLVSRVRRGYAKEYHEKIVYVNISDHSASSPIDKLHYTTDRGLRLLSDLRTDDILLFATAEHVFNRDFVVFLKLFHNYPQPVLCDTKKYLYGFHWKVGDGVDRDLQKRVYSTNQYHLARKGRSVDGQGANGRVNQVRDGAKSVNSKKNGEKASNDKNGSSGKKEVMEETHLKTTTPGLDSLQFADLYGAFPLLMAEKQLSSLPRTCALSVHLFSNVFESKVTRLHDEELIFKPQHLTFFESLQQPLFPWTYSNSGWVCHLCMMTPPTIFEKLHAQSPKDRPKWFDAKRYRDMLQVISDLKAAGKDEYLRQAVETGIRLDDADSLKQLPGYLIQLKQVYASLWTGE